jgi:MFS family permease
MAADSVPRAHMAAAIGRVQVAHRLGPAIGPVIGGLLAPAVGLRAAFLVACSVYVFALGLVVFLYHERATPGEPDHRRSQAARVSFRNVLAFENFVLLMAALFAIQLADRSLAPILPLIVGTMGVPASRVPLVSGILFSTVAASAAFGNGLCDRLLRRASARAVIAGAVVASSAGAVGGAVAQTVWILGVSVLLFGAGIGVAMTAAYTAAGTLIPRTVHGTGFGLLSSASLAGLALSPVLSGLLAAQSIRMVFVLDSVVLLFVALLVLRVMIEAPARTETPLIEEG